ncbi:PH domain-containing protein [Saccharata proteae CBS 121410]|uniref:PH domain-containing protein n=1 Tax=Saccharata proteae CBS 121410 TaxID=1314787 RepID=A0A9P4LZS0_9PEZI|nr:PH domain-containing protein [Saccharata proteae CBS 121410]
MASPTESTLPTRSSTNMTDDVMGDEDASETTKLFEERLQAWKHACGYLEDYVSATEKMQHAHGKEYDKVLKTVSSPLKEAHHFDQNLGGISGMFDNIRTNTQGISNSHTETAKNLKGQVLPVFERLHAEIKNKNKELAKGAGKQGKLVDKARAATQKHIELLGTHTATFDSHGGKMTASEDPYVIQRGVMHRLNKQVIEENNNRQDLLAVQNNFAGFEAHIISVIQSGMGQFMQILTAQQEQTKGMYADMVANGQRITPDFEWNGFVQRNNNLLIDPNAPPRSVSNIGFPNQGHRATQPLVAGSLDLKGRMMGKYSTSYWVLTPSKFLHEFKTDDDFQKDPSPDTSLYIPDCIIGGIDGNKFNVKGKDVSKGKVGNAFSTNHEYKFKAHTPSDAEKWWNTIRSSAGQTTNDMPGSSEPTSPTTSRQASGTMTPGAMTPGEEKPAPLQTSGITDGSEPASATTAPASGLEKKPGEY